MDSKRFQKITRAYAKLRIAIVGDFCLDRYFDIDPGKQEISIETNLPVHNIVQVRCQPGGAGTILNNLSALGVGAIYPIGFAGKDGEGFELRNALERRRGVRLDYFTFTPDRKTFTYTKPLLIRTGKTPEELNRLDIKNWSTTPRGVVQKLVKALNAAARNVDAIIVLDQVDIEETGVVTRGVLAALGGIVQRQPKLLAIADSRRGLSGFPQVCFKMNRAEFSALTGSKKDLSVPALRRAAVELAKKHGRPVFVTLAEQGIVAASPDGESIHEAPHRVRGEIDIVGAGDAVTANLAAGLAAGASLPEAVSLANAAASIVIHQLGTTGTASVAQIAELLRLESSGRSRR